MTASKKINGGNVSEMAREKKSEKSSGIMAKGSGNKGGGGESIDIRKSAWHQSASAESGGIWRRNGMAAEIIGGVIRSNHQRNQEISKSKKASIGKA